MIGRLKGTVATMGEDSAIIDVNGVGYEVSMTPRSLSHLTVGDQVTLSIETLVAETFIRLVGFEQDAERRAFKLLQSVQGVGSKAALAILQVLTPSELLDAVVVGDKTSVARAQGVGPKLAQRVVTELKGKTGSILGADLHTTSPAAANDVTTDVPSSGIRHDAVLALMNLGYDDAAARRAIMAAGDGHQTVEALITSALKGMATQ